MSDPPGKPPLSKQARLFKHLLGNLDQFSEESLKKLEGKLAEIEKEQASSDMARDKVREKLRGDLEAQLAEELDTELKRAREEKELLDIEQKKRAKIEALRKEREDLREEIDNKDINQELERLRQQQSDRGKKTKKQELDELKASIEKEKLTEREQRAKAEEEDHLALLEEQDAELQEARKARARLDIEQRKRAKIDSLREERDRLREEIDNKDVLAELERLKKAQSDRGKKTPQQELDELKESLAEDRKSEREKRAKEKEEEQLALLEEQDTELQLARKAYARLEKQIKQQEKLDELKDEREKLQEELADQSTIAELKRLQKVHENRNKKSKQEELSDLHKQINRDLEDDLREKANEDDAGWEERRDKQFRTRSGYARRLDVRQAFNFRRDQQSAFGYLTSLTIGTRMLAPGYMLEDPSNPSAMRASVTNATGRPGMLRVLGVLSDVSWDLGAEDPMRFVARIPPPIKATIMGLQYAAMAAVDVAVSWVVFEYDQSAKGYYVAFSSSTSGTAAGGTPVKGQIVKTERGSALELRVAFEPAEEVLEPQNFEIEFQMRPKTGVPQQIYIGTSRLGRVFKTWGVAAAR